MTKKRRRRKVPAVRRPDPEILGFDQLAVPDIEDGVGIEASHPTEARRETRAAGRERFREGLHEEWQARVREDYAYVKRDLKRIASISTLLLTIILLLWVLLEVIGVGL